MNLKNQYAYRAFVGADNNTFSYLITTPDSKTILASNINPHNTTKQLYERRHIASLRALVGCLTKLQFLNIEDAHITIDSKLNCDALNREVDYTRFSLYYRRLIHQVRQMLLALNNVELMFDYHNPIKFIIKNNVSFHEMQKEWDKIKSLQSDDVANFIYDVDIKSAKDQYRIQTMEPTKIYCSGFNGYLSYVGQYKDTVIVNHVAELTFEQKAHSSKPHYLQIASVNLALDYMERTNPAKTHLYLSDMEFMNEFKSLGKLGQQCKTDLLELSQRLNRHNLEIIFTDKNKNLARSAIKKLSEDESSISN